MLKLSQNAQTIVQRYYLQKDKQGKVVETPEQMFRRVAHNVAESKKQEEEFYSLLSSLEFLPNSPALMNAGTDIQQLASVCVLPIEDSLDSIFQTLHKAAIIHKSGGGTGFDFSQLRSKNDFILETAGKSSGPVSFLQAYDAAFEQIKQAGRRKGANMGILRCDHADIDDFIGAKQKYPLSNFNLSVAITDQFMDALAHKRDFFLQSPHTRKRSKINPGKLWDLLCENAWNSGDPGVIFIDTLNRKHPLPGKVAATSPCGEQPLLAYESCILGSVNLGRHCSGAAIDWEKLGRNVRLGVEFLDNCIDRTQYRFPEIEKATKKNRKIGLGVMGFADLLFQLHIPYNSTQGLKVAEDLMKFVQAQAQQASEELAKRKGAFPNFKNSKLDLPRRNATLTTIAPTGTIALIAGCSPGIEPVFALAFTNEISGGKKIKILNPHLVSYLKEKKWYTKKIIERIARIGSIQHIPQIDNATKEIFLTSMEISPISHLKMQATFQKYTDNAVSKTVNLPHSASIEDVAEIFETAYDLGCKGVTVYRDGSKQNQVLKPGV